jgi:hypothetical protein
MLRQHVFDFCGQLNNGFEAGQVQGGCLKNKENNEKAWWKRR